MKTAQSPKAEKRVAIYCRVSTFDQGKGAFSSLDSQQENLRQFCKSRGWMVVDVYSDTKTGTTLDRSEMNRLLKDASDRRFDVVAVTKLDRISRSVKDFLDLDEKLNALNIDIVVTTQNIDTTTPSGKMQRTILLAFAEFERDMIAERTREKLYSQAQNGYWGGGNTPLGYDVINKKLVVNAKEVELVTKIFKYYLEEPSTNKVAHRLNDEGFRAKKRVTKEGKNIGGGDFNYQHVHDILRSKLYRGIITYKNEDFQGLHNAIVDEQLFNAVQDRLEKSRTDRYATYDKSDLLLLGLAHCGFCGSNMTTTYAKKEDSTKYLYYKCTQKSKFGAAKCECRDLSAEQLEGLIEKIIILIGEDNSIFDAVFKQISENDNIGLKDLKVKRDEISGNLGRIKKEIDNLTKAIAQSENNLGLPALLASLEVATAQRFKAENELLQLNTNIHNIEGQSIPKELLRKRYADLAKVYPGLEADRKRKLTRSIIRELGCLVKKKEDKGQIRIAFKGDGTVLQDWDIKENPEAIASRFLVEWLRE